MSKKLVDDANKSDDQHVREDWDHFPITREWFKDYPGMSKDISEKDYNSRYHVKREDRDRTKDNKEEVKNV